MTDVASSSTPDPGLLRDALDALPEGAAVFDADWTIVEVNEPGARLLGRSRGHLLDRNIWIALPELGGTIFHSFLLHARSVGERVTWHGFYAPAGRWLSASATRIGDRLYVTFRGDRDDDGATAGADLGVPAEAGSGGGDQDRLRFLAEVSEAMISTLDTGESVEKLADLVVPRLADWAVVAVLGDDGAPANERGRAHRDPARLVDVHAYLDRRLRGTGDDSPMVTALFTGEPIQIAPIDYELVRPALATEEVRLAWERLDTTSCLIVPLRARSETFGAIGLMNTGDRPPHSEMEMATAVEVARRASLALDNARLYGRQLQVAETLQRSLLTPPPQPEHLAIAVRYRPASRNMHVGGDWYDAFQQPDGATLLVIGDVVGHNVDAAAEMGQVRSIVRGIAYDRQEGPARILTRVDEVLGGLRIGTLATALIARVEQEAGGAGRWTLRWSSAGHVPPLLRRAGGAVEVLDSPPETLLGTDVARPRSDHEARLGPGDTVVFYTDGLIEQGRTLIDDGIVRLTRLVAEAGHLPPAQLCDELLARLIDDRSDDDIAIVAVRCDPEDASA